ncbi:uncharacterized protein BO97DRAFT_407935 [Aspergillus homomorphus CBS 101889]|uniref:Uncharacterized protein n=1 Tax=Aspergillus homomorphus (strain CBS 101889) TaxID=1450537 RepID=A0A395HNN9_ASPHC|nr:hypothetical protein BO97DRAFT_407935 [Aspergillus homomorphus CBS 101889]RAL09043.1 hypothetical protein BO97DRAFT_407935 [Aspergillus homomorphus CBS 101889]
MVNYAEPLHFEKDFGDFAKLGTLIIKGTVDRRNGNITGEIGVKTLGMYKSIHGFTGNLYDGVHGKFATGVGYGDSSFNIKIKDGAVVAQANLWEKGTQMTLFKLDELMPAYDGKLRYGAYLNEVGTILVYSGPSNEDHEFGFDFFLPINQVIGPTDETIPVKCSGPLRNTSHQRYTATFEETALKITIGQETVIRGTVSNKEWKEAVAKLRGSENCYKVEGNCTFVS